MALLAFHNATGMTTVSIQTPLLMTTPSTLAQPDNTAARTALWRALHRETDLPPVFEDTVGLQLLAPDEHWRQRPDMHPQFTQRLRASVAGRARFTEDQVLDAARQGMRQYVLLGAGLDTFVQRHPGTAAYMDVYEIDQPGTLAWKEQRLQETGYGLPDRLHLVPVDFEQQSWWQQLLHAGFDAGKPAIITSTGVTLYLSTEAIKELLRHMAALAPGSLSILSFYLPIDLLDEADRPLQLMAEKGARAAGTPFVSFFTPGEVMSLAREAGFRKYRTVSTEELTALYFAGRADGLLPATGEIFLVAET